MKRSGIVLSFAVLAMLSPAWAQRDPGMTPEKALSQLPEGYRHERVIMPLRDGVKLITEVFLPPGEGPWPTMLLRTPYTRWDLRAMAPMGWRKKDGRYAGGVPCALVLQNMRGRYGSEGTLPPVTFDNEIDDGYDTIEWVAKQKWSNGRVGMWGPSGHGVGPMNALWSNAPHLTAVSVNVTGDNSYLHWTFNNGARRKMYSWLSTRNMKITDWPRPTIYPFDLAKHKAFLKERAAKCTAALDCSGGWFDLFHEGPIDAFEALQHTGKAYVRMSAGGHGALGGLKFPSARSPSGLKTRTFKDWMTDPDGDGKTVSTLVYYLMGDAKDKSALGNVYKATTKWPVDHVATDYYLHADGSLGTAAPKDAKGFLSYTYDPKDPVQSLGGNYAIGAESGAHDQRPLKDRKDILRFATEPLAEPVGITGKVFLELHVSSDAPDTMFTAKLVDIYPDGYEAVIRESAMVARFYQGLNKPAPLAKGKVYVLKMDMGSTAIVFNQGHRLALHVSSSSKPAYEVHPNTYKPAKSIDEARVAHNTVHTSAAHASKLILPVVPKETYAKK
ncbi:MAG TPA: CocE/NonD family hydrolase [Phycisphaerae bacterium]|nr:CocE/NonD family hydrolase [Phycisphaerae bacterium]